MSWGGTNPETLVLGFSKGERQTGEIETVPHGDVPFRGFRRPLEDALRRLGLLRGAKSLDQIIAESDQDWAFGSMTRCTIALWDEASTAYRKSGTLISKYSRFGPQNWIENCIQAHLKKFPSKLRNVVVLSNDKDFIECCFRAVCKAHPETRRINSVAYRSGEVTWAHIVHVGGPGKNHIKNWFDGAPGLQGEKMRAACAAFASK